MLAPTLILRTTTTLAVFLAAAIFGFFYAWVCSAMWGLDQIDPRNAITAMNAMNTSVRNAVFMPAFFGTPLVLALSAALAWFEGFRISSLWLATGAVLYFFGAFLLTALVNVPMNRELIEAGTPASLEEARAVWDTYSPRWQTYNQTRTVVAAVAFGLSLMGLIRLFKPAD